MLTPFQRLLQHSTHGLETRRVLLAASGPSIRVFDSSTGHFISKWSHLDADSLSRDATPGSQEEDAPEDRPTKKRKTENGNTSETPSAEIVIENGSGRRGPSHRGKIVSCITHMLSTSDGRHVVIVTGEDKSLRVLSISEEGALHQVSQRTVTKRPSALTMTPDGKSILCADKFGDVYALPLLGKSFRVVVEPDDSKDEALLAEEMFKPSASSKTVHTKRNLRALESQQKQKKVKKKQRDEWQFDQELLLGHVSLLTDVACVSIQSEQDGNKTYILTADRDEHIRVSRGMPQAHIIENFCLGHEQFVSKIHIPHWQPETLISGGGDEFLLVWQWQNGLMRQKLDLNALVPSLGSDEVKGSPKQLAVSGIWSMQTKSGGQIVVACESSPSLSFFAMSASGIIESKPSFQATLAHNVLDVAVLPHEQSIFVSLDNIHKVGTTHEASTDNSSEFVVKFAFDVASDNGSWSGVDDEAVTQINAAASSAIDASADPLTAATLGDVFYNIEHLRKRGGPEAPEDRP